MVNLVQQCNIKCFIFKSHGLHINDGFNILILGFEVNKKVLDEVAELSQVMEISNDFISQAVRDECERVVPKIEDVKPKDAALTYIFLKTHFKEPSTAS